MGIQNYFLLYHIRKEPYFFWCRIIIGMIIALSIHHYGAVNPQQIILEIKSKQILLVLVTLALCGLMAVTRLLKPQSSHIHKVQKAAIELCKAAIMFVRGALIMGISAILYCMIVELDRALMLTFANFVFALELASSVYAGLDSFTISE